MTETVREWGLQFSPELGYAPVTLSWDSAQVPLEGRLTLRDGITGSFVNVDMREQSSVTIEQEFITQVVVEHTVVEASAPVVTPEAGTYVDNVEVSMSTSSEGALVYYTLDGSEPTEESLLYEEPLVLEETTTVKALASGPGYVASEVTTSEYTLLVSTDVPVFSPGAGSYADSVEVVMSSPTVGALVYYTLDGSDPTEESLLYEEPLVLKETTTVKAVSGGEGYAVSEVGTAAYEILVSAQMPMLTPDAGTYVDSVEVVMSSPTAGASVYYTLDGSEPTEESLLYEEPLVLEETTTVKAIAGGTGYVASEVAESAYEIVRYALSPVASEAGGFYVDSVEVTLSSPTAGVLVYYTLDGSEPTEASSQYSDPLMLEETTTVKAIAVGGGYLSSEVMEELYRIVDYRVDVTVSDTDNVSLTLTLGTAAGGTESLNTVYDQLAPPPPPSGSFDARLKVGGQDYFRKYLPTNENSTEWLISFSPAQGHEPITLTWDPALIPSVGTFILSDVVDGSYVNVNMMQQNSVTVQQSFISELRVTHLLQNQIQQTYSENWNLVSLPVLTDNNSYQELFPTASLGTLYSFTVNYIAVEELTPGEGYWLRLDEEDTVTMAGQEITSQTLNLQKNWNIIGSISQEAVLNDPDQLIIPGTIYGFDINYVAVDRIEIGKGYWLSTFNAGEVTLVPSSATQISSNEQNLKNPVRSPEVLDRFRSLRFIQGDGNLLADESQGRSQGELAGQASGDSPGRALGEIYFGGSFDQEFHPLQMQLPPVPPAGSFDVRTEEHGWITENSEVLVRFQSPMESDQSDGSLGDRMQSPHQLIIIEGAKVGADAGSKASDGDIRSGGAGLVGTVTYRVQFLDAQRQPISPVHVVSGIQMDEYEQFYGRADGEGSGERYGEGGSQGIRQGFGYGVGDVHDGVGNQTLEVPAGTAWISVETITTGNELPAEFELRQNYPNPFNPSTNIEYALPEVADVQLEVYNMLGQRVATLVDAKQQAAGSYNFVFNASNLSSGMYIYRINTGKENIIKRMTLIK